MEDFHTHWWNDGAGVIFGPELPTLLEPRQRTQERTPRTARTGRFLLSWEADEVRQVQRIIGLPTEDDDNVHQQSLTPLTAPLTASVNGPFRGPFTRSGHNGNVRVRLDMNVGDGSSGTATGNIQSEDQAPPPGQRSTAVNVVSLFPLANARLGIRTVHGDVPPIRDPNDALPEPSPLPGTAICSVSREGQWNATQQSSFTDTTHYTSSTAVQTEKTVNPSHLLHFDENGARLGPDGRRDCRDVLTPDTLYVIDGRTDRKDCQPITSATF
ncbi:hypothetical protein CBOM_01569 [Ceraceosorus bombacis]|uniref:Uncharacterized protein n=1 Tax=Ceraceosorus bombacis TaxID=401625 RepID=A0A0N7L9F8_9BASI|nr:hypothetical protein CBOM_01569 [Ceraceosorus bombacis]